MFFFPSRDICLAYRLSLVRASESIFPVHDIQRVQGKPCKLPRGQLASLGDRIKGFTFPSERLWMKQDKSGMGEGERIQILAREQDQYSCLCQRRSNRILIFPLLQSASLKLMVLRMRLGYDQSLVGWEYRGGLKGAGRGPATGTCVHLIRFSTLLTALVLVRTQTLLRYGFSIHVGSPGNSSDKAHHSSSRERPEYDNDIVRSNEPL